MPQKESLLERASHRPFICELRLYLVNLFVCLFFGKGTCEFVMVQETRATRRGNFHALVIRAQVTDPDSRRCLQTESGHGPCWLKPLSAVKFLPVTRAVASLGRKGSSRALFAHAGVTSEHFPSLIASFLNPYSQHPGRKL